ncbi:hypothetical protein AKJ16_DCAP01197 [Drosera capensis]
MKRVEFPPSSRNLHIHPAQKKPSSNITIIPPRRPTHHVPCFPFPSQSERNLPIHVHAAALVLRIFSRMLRIYSGNLSIGPCFNLNCPLPSQSLSTIDSAWVEKFGIFAVFGTCP